MPNWNVFNKIGQAVGSVEAPDKETAETLSREIFGFDAVDLDKDEREGIIKKMMRLFLRDGDDGD
jgi:hypothetical protein